MRCSGPLVLACVVMGLLGCAPSLPRVGPVPFAQSIQTLRERADAVETVAAEGRLTLTDSRGQRVTLDAVLVSEGDQRMRIRTWKLNQAVFDLTRNEDGLWLWQSSRMQRQAVDADELSPDHLMAVWRLMRGQVFHDTPSDAIDGTALDLTYPLHFDDVPMTLQATIDRSTLVPVRYVLLDEAQRVRLTLRLERYRMIGEVPWPMRITAESDEGTVRIAWSHVALNEPTATGAFKPPSRAERRP